MARKPITELRSDTAAKFPDNTTGEISPADLRSFLGDFLDTISPGYGILDLEAVPAVQNISGATPQVLTAYDREFLTTEPFSASSASGKVTAQQQIVANITVTISCEFATNRVLVLTLYRDEEALPYSITVDGRGAGNPIGLSVSGIIELTAGQTVDVRGLMDGVATDVTFQALALIVQAIPLRDAIPEQ